MMAHRVEIVDADATTEALTLRSILEHLGARVGLSLIGTPAAFLDALSLPCATLILCGHGNARGFLLGPYGAAVDTSLLLDGALPPSAIAGAQIAAPLVISTACQTGRPAMARAMLSAGASAYAAPTGFIDGRAPLLILHRAFHANLRQGCPLDSAIETAQEALPDEDRFTWFTTDEAAK